MRSSLLTGLFAAVLAAVAPSVGAGVGQAAPARAQLRGYKCHTARDPEARKIMVTAVMRPVAGTQALEIKFDLLVKPTGASSFSAVTGVGLGAWITPVDPTLGRRPGDVFIVHHPVRDLARPGIYRFRVTFRWLGLHRKVLATVTKSSPRCNQPELRPDLQIASFTAQPIAGRPKLDRYLAVVLNAGATAARSFMAQFTDAGRTASVMVPRLRAHAHRTLMFTGPVCHSASPPTLVLDPQGVVDEFDTANNVASAVCPAGS